MNISQRILQAHCQSPASHHADQSVVKELAKPTQVKIVFNPERFRDQRFKKKIAEPTEANDYTTSIYKSPAYFS